MKITWSLRTFSELSTEDLYSVLRLRQEVFVVEQNCPYLDCDNYDQSSHHLLGWLIADSTKELVAYLRILPPDALDGTPHMGRVLCHKKFRQQGLGRRLVQQGLLHCSKLFPKKQINISAQLYLIDFYTDLGFQPFSSPYDEDGIPHIGMVYEKDANEQ